MEGMKKWFGGAHHDKDRREWTHEDWVWQRVKDRVIAGVCGAVILAIVELIELICKHYKF